MSYEITIDQVRQKTAFAKNSLEAGEYVFRVANVIKKVADRGYNDGKEVYVFFSNPLKDNNNASSFDRSRSLPSEVVIPVFAEGIPVDDSKKRVRSFAFWAQVFGVVAPPPEKTGNKKADWEAYEEWCVGATNALHAAVDSGSVVGAMFNGEIAITEGGFPRLVKKSAI